jgi:hypothetical protein
MSGMVCEIFCANSCAALSKRKTRFRFHTRNGAATKYERQISPRRHEEHEVENHKGFESLVTFVVRKACP